MVRPSAWQFVDTRFLPSLAQCDGVRRTGTDAVAAAGAALGIDEDSHGAAKGRRHAKGGFSTGIGARAAIDAARRQATLRYGGCGRSARDPARASQEPASRNRHCAELALHQTAGPCGPPSISAIQIPSPRAPTIAIEIAGRRTITRKRKDRSSRARSSLTSSAPGWSDPKSPPNTISAYPRVERFIPSLARIVECGVRFPLTCVNAHPEQSASCRSTESADYIRIQFASSSCWEIMLSWMARRVPTPASALHEIEPIDAADGG